MSYKNDTLLTIMLRLTWVLFLSILFHFVTFELIWFTPTPSRSLSSRETVQIDLVDTHKDKNKQPDSAFDQPAIKNTVNQNLQDLKDKADFLAEKAQRFNKQTKAALNGAFHNETATSPHQQNQQQKQVQLFKENKNYLDKVQKEENIKAAEKANSLDDITVTQNTKKNNRQTSNQDTPEFAQAIQSATSRPSAQPFDLPQEIEFGSATNLNADAHIYASFYNRVIEMFYIRWSQRLEAMFDRMPMSAKQQLAGRSWVTDLEIDLNEKGIFEKGFIMKNSGFKPFDDAGLFAFKDAQYFPNPPKEKIEADGKIRLRYRIAVNVR